MLQAKKAQIQPFTSINQSQSASKEEKPVTETIDVRLLSFLDSQIRTKDDAYYEVPLYFSSDSIGIRE